jgi:2-polyprenyl-6-methoxyphenol hydroxylase-like FAD-dependent oxidoreductase
VAQHDLAEQFPLNPSVDIHRSTMPRPARTGRRAIVIGGSMSGLFTAALLRRIGWDVDVYERSPVELVGRGAGITTHPELLEVLALCGAATPDLGVAVEKRILLDHEGRIIGEHRLPQILTSWDLLQRLLRGRVPGAHYHLGRSVVGFDQDGRSVEVRFADGGSERADLLVGADGFRSSVRALVAPEVQPAYAGYVIWRGAPAESALAPATRRAIFPYFTFFLPARQQIIGYPIAGFDNALEPGRRRYNFIWYRVVDAAALREMCRDAEGRRHDFSIPPDRIRPEVVEAMRRDAEATMPEVFLDVLGKVERPFFTPIHDFASPRLVFGRVVLIGDAGANSRPHMGFGVSKAAEDAKALAEALGAHDGDIDRGLAGFEALRQPIGERVMLYGRKLGTHLGVDLKTDEDRAMWRRMQDPMQVLRLIAAPHFLASAA